MDEAHKELVKRLTATRTQRDLNWNDVTYPINPDGEEAARALEALAGERNTSTANLKGLQQQVRDLVAERDRLKAALEDAKEMVISWGSYAPTYFAEKHDLLGDIEQLNKALGDAS